MAQSEFDKKAWAVFWTILAILVFITICASSRGDVADDILAAMAKEKGYTAKDNVINYGGPCQSRARKSSE